MEATDFKDADIINTDMSGAIAITNPNLFNYNIVNSDCPNGTNSYTGNGIGCF